jgi:hypothetical protein
MLSFEQELLSTMEFAMLDPLGMFSEGVPVLGIGDELVRRGFAVLAWPKFHGVGVYRLTDLGMKYVMEKVPPAEW